MSWSQHLRNPQDFIKVGDMIEAVVLTIDRGERKMSLGIKQLTEDPWTRQDVLTKYAVGSVHKGIVRNLTNFGLFLELEEGIDGLVHVSDLSWTKKVKHPSEFVKVGDTLEVKVLELDGANRRLALSHKHLEENPWDTFENIFSVGSVHKGTVVNKNDKGFVVELPYGIEGFVSLKNASKEDSNSKTEIGETLDFKVLEFSKEDRRISLSHRSMWSAEEEKPVAAPKKKPESKGPFDSGFFFGAATGFSSSADHMERWLREMRRSSFENSSTLKSSVSPISVFELLSSLEAFFNDTKPSIPYGSSTTNPLSFLLTTVPLCTDPTEKIFSNVSHGFSSRCLWLNARRRFAPSSSSTFTSRVSPTFTNSEGCFTFFVQLKSDTCTSPSIPSSSSRNNPKLVRLRTIPL